MESRGLPVDGPRGHCKGICTLGNSVGCHLACPAAIGSGVSRGVHFGPQNWTFWTILDLRMVEIGHFGPPGVMDPHDGSPDAMLRGHQGPRSAPHIPGIWVHWPISMGRIALAMAPLDGSRGSHVVHFGPFGSPDGQNHQISDSGPPNLMIWGPKMTHFGSLLGVWITPPPVVPVAQDGAAR